MVYERIKDPEKSEKAALPETKRVQGVLAKERGTAEM
jgi:hypothetical protein